MRIRALLFTCEHGGNRVPREYATLFASTAARSALAGHRGHDLGALTVARALARALGAELLYSTTTRLLVELNRSPGHAGLFSEYSKRLDARERSLSIQRYHTPHRERVLEALESRLARGGLVCHVGVHSFAPVWRGERRSADIGLLYDPRRPYESAVCARWQRAFGSYDPGLRVRRNYPYLGKADGLTTSLRRTFAADQYVGIELEMNQRLLTADAKVRRTITPAIAASLQEVLQADF